MAKITMELIKKLREKTQVGMMDCKKALQEAAGDIEKAVELLRKKGAAIALKRADNATDNGHIESCLSDDNKKGVLLKISCETDFSANTQDMKNFAKDICKHILKNETSDINTLSNETFFDSEMTITQKLEELISKIAESIKIEKYVMFKTNSKGFINSYIHPGSNLGVMVEIDSDKDINKDTAEAIKKVSHDICMQIAVTNPIAIKPEKLDKSILKKEQEIIREQLLNSGKPKNIIEKIMQGKLNKFYEEVCLNNQKFIKDDKKSVKKVLEETGKKFGLNLKIKQFARFNVGK